MNKLFIPLKKYGFLVLIICSLFFHNVQLFVHYVLIMCSLCINYMFIICSLFFMMFNYLFIMFHYFLIMFHYFFIIGQYPTVLDRDHNAAKNILNCLICLLFDLPRPLRLQRSNLSTTTATTKGSLKLS